MNYSRRDVLRLGAGAALGIAAGLNLPAAMAAPCCGAKKKPRLGLQLYSVRRQCAQDLKSVIEAVGKMGYEGVEFAGYHGRSAEELRKMLDDNGLVCCGTHTHINTLLGDEFEKTVAFNKTIGNPFLIIPSLPGGHSGSADELKKTAEIFTELTEKAKAFDMHVGYHAHGGDFKKYDGVTGWDILFDNTPKEFVMQMDTGNCLGGGGDPIATLKKYPGRALTVHLKEHGGSATAAIGEGDVDWKEVFEVCETIGGTQWYIVEHERGSDPLVSVKACIDNIKKMRG